MNNWLVVGYNANWWVGVEQKPPIWGLKPGYMQRYKTLIPGDTIWCYVTAPVRGIVGCAKVIEIIREDDPINNRLLWIEEHSAEKIVWPLRFRFRTEKLLPVDQWEVLQVPIDHFGLDLRDTFQLLADAHVSYLKQNCPL
jgi:hypothetical protein